MFWSIFGFCVELIIFAMIIVLFTTSVLLGGLLLLLWSYIGPGTITCEFADLDKSTEKEEDEYNSLGTSPLTDMIGAEGITISILRPEGKVMINGQKYRARTFRDFMEADVPIVVIEAKHNTLIVEEVPSYADSITPNTQN